MSLTELRAAIIEEVTVYLEEPTETAHPYAVVGYEGDKTRHIIQRFGTRREAIGHRVSLLEKLPMLLMVPIGSGTPPIHEPYRDLLP